MPARNVRTGVATLSAHVMVVTVSGCSMKSVHHASTPKATVRRTPAMVHPFSLILNLLIR